jgi:hypothetical protein
LPAEATTELLLFLAEVLLRVCAWAAGIASTVVMTAIAKICRRRFKALLGKRAEPRTMSELLYARATAASVQVHKKSRKIKDLRDFPQPEQEL